MKRIKSIFILLIMMLIITGSSFKPALSSGYYDVTRISVYDVAEIVKNQRGSILVFMIYSPTCSISRGMFPQFVELSNKYQGKVGFFVCSSDCDTNMLKQYLNQFSLSFRPFQISQWQPGELVRTLDTIGIKIGSVYIQPLVGIYDRNNNLVVKGEGVGDVGSIEAVLKELLKN